MFTPYSTYGLGIIVGNQFLFSILFRDWVWPNFIEWGLILLLGGFTQVAQITLTKALQTDKAANATVLKYLGVVHAFLIGWLIFGEVVSWLSIVGTLIVLIGIVLFGLKKKVKQI